MQKKVRSMAKAAACLAAMAFMSGCNGVGARDSLLARFDDESVYKEDQAMLAQNFNKNQDWNSYIYENLYAKAAVASVAQKEYPEIEKEWDAYFKDIDQRILTSVYQRYFVTECMMYSDSELRRFYDVNRNLFPADSTGEYSRIRGKVAGEYYISKNSDEFAAFLTESAKNSKPDSTKAGVDTASAKQNFIAARRAALKDSASANVLERTGYRIQPLPEVDPKSYYEKHKDLFVTAPGYVLYHVQMADSAKLIALFGDSLSLEQFKAIAASSSLNKETAKDSGLVGYVKQKYALPGGIGMVQGLAESLEGKNPGFVTPVLRSVGQSAFHRFYLAELVPSQVKPFDRAIASIKAEIAKGSITDVDSDYAVITKNGKPVFTEGDLERFNREYMGNRKITVETHGRLTRMIAETMAYASLAQSFKLDHSWEYRALVRSTRWNFIFDRYIEKKMGVGSVPEDSLRSLYVRLKNNIRGDLTFEQVRGELEKIAAFPMNMYRHEYLFGYRMIYKGETFDQSMTKIFSQRNPNILVYQGRRYSAEAYSKVSTHFYGADAPQYEPDAFVDKMVAKADSLYKSGKIDDAYYAYRDIMYTYPENDSLFQFAAYALAQVQSDEEEYDGAEAEYYAFYRMWPNNENAEKAMFSRGFILSENQGKDSLALQVFHEFLEKYPNSDLKESADWLVKNIESNGKMTEELLKKIETEE